MIPVAAAGPGTWRIAFSVPVEEAAAFARWADAAYASYSAFEQDDRAVRFDLLVHGEEPDAAGLDVELALVAKSVGGEPPSVGIEPVPDRDWRAATYAAFPPLRIGRFLVHGSHDAGAAGPGALGLRIDAATAFGTGEHPTTEGCLLALQWLARRHRPRRLLDLGCGSGILAMAMARLWRRPVLAADIDAEAVRVTRRNADDNGLGGLIRAVEAGDPARLAIARHAPFDLVAANILARPLIGLSAGIARTMPRGGFLVLSGLLRGQAPAVLAWYRLQGFALVRRFPAGEWETLLVRR